MIVDGARWPGKEGDVLKCTVRVSLAKIEEQIGWKTDEPWVKSGFPRGFGGSGRSSRI